MCPCNLFEKTSANDLCDSAAWEKTTDEPGVQRQNKDYTEPSRSRVSLVLGSQSNGHITQ